MASYAYSDLTCDRCPASLPPMRGTANDIRARARLDEGWVRVRGEYNIPMDLCCDCAAMWRRQTITAQIERRLGVRA